MKKNQEYEKNRRKNFGTMLVSNNKIFHKNKFKLIILPCGTFHDNIFISCWNILKILSWMFQEKVFYLL